MRRRAKASGFELPRAGFMSEIVEVQIDLGELRPARRPAKSSKLRRAKLSGRDGSAQGCDEQIARVAVFAACIFWRTSR